MKMRTFVSKLALVGIMILGMGIFAGCGKQTTETASLPESGTLLLKVNPEIAIEYDGNGRVTSVQGRNEDGKDIVSGYQDYIGKECREVVGDLVKEIQKAGYFVEEVEGRSRKITIEIETGSILPKEDFLDQIVADVQKCVADMKVNSPVVMPGETDYETTLYSISDYGVSAYEAKPPVSSAKEPEKPASTPAPAPASTPKPGVTDYEETPYTPYEVSPYEESPYTPYEKPAPAPAPAPQPEATDYEETPYTPYEASPYEETPYEATPYEATDYEETPYTPYEASSYETTSYSDYE